MANKNCTKHATMPVRTIADVRPLSYAPCYSQWFFLLSFKINHSSRTPFLSVNFYFNKWPCLKNFFSYKQTFLVIDISGYIAKCAICRTISLLVHTTTWLIVRNTVKTLLCKFYYSFQCEIANFAQHISILQNCIFLIILQKSNIIHQIIQFI